ncbi:hypothetical protein GTY60_07815 [Streptomyces sp. SID8367]|nr:hypothetical protein [Streptomyces sp. SID8367]
MACSVIGILFSMLRVFARFVQGVAVCLARASCPGATKNPSCREASEGSAPGAVAGIPMSEPVVPASADALSKYENSGAHGTDPPPGAHSLSSGWDGSLIM